MTKDELLAHIDRWRDTMIGDLNALQDQSLLDQRVVASTLRGAVNDLNHLYLIVRELIRRLPREDK